MGTYLSTPASDKYKEWGEDLNCPVQPIRWAVVDMQGWRKSMEDAHIVESTVPYPPGLPYLTSKEKDKIPKAKVFGVFDGHGGPEVARFCQLYLVSVLTKQKLWQEEEESAAAAAAEAEGNGDSASEPKEEEKTPAQQDDAENTGIGRALIETFHALDRMIDDPARRDEIVRLRTNKAPPTERREAGTIPPVKPIDPIQNGTLVKATELAQGGEADNILPPPPPPPEGASTEIQETNDESDDSSPEQNEPKEEEAVPESTASSVSSSETNSDDPNSEEASPEKKLDDYDAAQKEESSEEETSEEEREDAKSDSSESDKDYDSDEAVGKEEAAERDQDLCEDEDDDEDSSDIQINPYDGAIQVVDGNNDDEDSETDPAVSPNKVTVMFQRLLNMNENQTGQMVIRVAGEDVEKDINNSSEQVQAAIPAGPSASTPSILQNGRLICNLPDHPIHAGCTAVVAVLLGMTLTVANAGDSRGVLCREGGVTEPLSYDHKPQQPREMNRINNAGGFVNRFGRVNGNLNLSRSVGDLKYKQVPGIVPADQMITAQPDILQVTLKPKDEFFILGCDGIWDCLTNEKAVEFVRERIDTKEPKDIGEEMLNTILSDDPRATQGIGGDNMTILIVDLQPASRSYNVEPAWGPPEAPSNL